MLNHSDLQADLFPHDNNSENELLHPDRKAPTIHGGFF
jgi:hypothetical protein